jgi:hypothetical protein
MTRSRWFAVLVLVVVLFATITGSVAEAAGPGNDKGSGKGKANGHTKQEERQQEDNNSGSSDNGGSDSADSGSSGGGSDSSDSGPNGNGNTGSSKTRKGLDDEKMNQNIYKTGDMLSYHVKNMHEGEYTIVVKEPGKNGEVVYTATVYVDASGNLDVELTNVPDDWSGVYQVQIVGADGHMKNDNINIRRKHVVDLPDTPEAPETPETPDVPDVPDVPEITTTNKPPEDDCVTVVYHASGPEVTVVEFFRPEHARTPWDYEDVRMGESRVENGAVMAHFAEGEVFVVFEYDEITGAYNYRATGEVIGDYDEVIHIWSDGDASSVLFNALIWTPVGATK